MAFTSYGYEGTIDEVAYAWSIMMAGVEYAVADGDDFQASIGGSAGDRALSFTPGMAIGKGVRVVSDAIVSLNLAPVSSGSRWDLIVLRRNWNTNVSTIDVVPGGASAVLPSRAVVLGGVDEQPLWLARVAAGQSAVQELIDLRVWAGAGGAFARSELVLSFLNALGTQIRIGNTMWSRVLDALLAPIWRKQDVTEDTGWVQAVPNGGWVWSECLVRRVGSVAFCRISAVRGEGWGVNGGLATIPAGFRPDRPVYMLSSYSTGAREFMFRADGEVVASQPSAGSTGATLMGSWLVS